MSMSSTFASGSRRSPQQARATQRRAKFLEVAAKLIGEQGYEIVTMMAIAAEAGASIGTLYDYFPDKRSVALALLSEYVEQADAHWAAILSGARTMTESELSELFIEGILTFVRAHPACLPLLTAPIGYSRTAEARQPLRRTIADALRKTKPSISADRAFMSAQVIVQLMKGMLALYKQVAAKDEKAVTAEFKALMLAYVSGLRDTS